MKEYAIPLMLSIITTLLNYIFISAITAKQQQLIIQDFKTTLDFILSELKSGQKGITDEIQKTEQNILSETKQSSQSKGYN